MLCNTRLRWDSLGVVPVLEPLSSLSVALNFPAWAQAARIVFALSPNSAACERVFSLLKRLFGEQQMDSLSDYLNAALKLNFNGRTVG